MMKDTEPAKSPVINPGVGLVSVSFFRYVKTRVLHYRLPGGLEDVDGGSAGTGGVAGTSCGMVMSKGPSWYLR
jgi:hypothetical protein